MSLTLPSGKQGRPRNDRCVLAFLVIKEMNVSYITPGLRAFKIFEISGTISLINSEVLFYIGEYFRHQNLGKRK